MKRTNLWALAASISLLLVSAPMSLAGTKVHAATHITLDGSSLGATYDGLGSVIAGAGSRLLADYPDIQKRQILDLLFRPKFGASLNHLKVEIGSDRHDKGKNPVNGC